MTLNMQANRGQEDGNDLLMEPEAGLYPLPQSRGHPAFLFALRPVPAPLSQPGPGQQAAARAPRERRSPVMSASSIFGLVIRGDI